MTARVWITGLALTALVPLAGCGNAANQAGNAAGFAGSQIANGVRQGWNTVGNATGIRPDQNGNNPTLRQGTGTAAMAGSHSVQVDNATRTIHIAMANLPANQHGGNLLNGNGNRAGLAGGTTASSWNSMHITVPTGWTIRLTGNRTGGDSIAMVPYSAARGPNGTLNPGLNQGANAGAAGFGASTNPRANDTSLYHANAGGGVGGANGVGSPGVRTPGTAMNNTRTNTANNMGTQVLRATTPGTYFIVYRQPGRREQVLEVVTVSNSIRMPSFSIDRNF